MQEMLSKFHLLNQRSVTYMTQKHQDFFKKILIQEIKKDPLSLNLYTYCHNNPLIYDDPTGHFAHILLGGLVGGVLSVAATGITNLVTTGKLGSAKQYVGAFASGFVEGAVGAATLGIGSIATKVAIDAKQHHLDQI